MHLACLSVAHILFAKDTNPFFNITAALRTGILYCVGRTALARPMSACASRARGSHRCTCHQHATSPRVGTYTSTSHDRESSVSPFGSHRRLGCRERSRTYVQCPDTVEHDVTQSPRDPFSEKTVYEDNLFGKLLIAYFTKKISEEVGADRLEQWMCGLPCCVIRSNSSLD